MAVRFDIHPSFVSFLEVYNLSEIRGSNTQYGPAIFNPRVSKLWCFNKTIINTRIIISLFRIKKIKSHILEKRRAGL